MRRVAKRSVRPSSTERRQVPQRQSRQRRRSPKQQVGHHPRSEGRRLIGLHTSTQRTPSRPIRAHDGNIDLLQVARRRRGFEQPRELRVGDGSQVAELLRVADADGAEVDRGVWDLTCYHARAVDRVDSLEGEGGEGRKAEYDNLKLFKVDGKVEGEALESRD